jgi:hypothetical protein
MCRRCFLAKHTLPPLNLPTPSMRLISSSLFLSIRNNFPGCKRLNQAFTRFERKIALEPEAGRVLQLVLLMKM